MLDNLITQFSLVKLRRLSARGVWLLLALPSVILAQPATVQPAAPDNLQSALTQCRTEPSALIRLACYDNLFKSASPVNQSNTLTVRSDTALKALELEKQRTEGSVEFLSYQGEGALTDEVIITTPALGILPPRPVLIFSCKDNITRMQIAFFSALPADKTSTLTLKTDNGRRIRSDWFVRDNGLLLEGSRGLPGIAEIQQLLNAESFSIESSNQALNGLSFQINGLAKAIAPLRQACRW